MRLLVTQHDGEIDRFPNFKEMIDENSEDYLADFEDDFQKTAPDIVMQSSEAFDSEMDESGGFSDYEELELDEIPDLDNFGNEFDDLPPMTPERMLEL